MFLRNIILFALVAVAASGCGPSATKRACMGGGGQSSLVTDAAMLRLDVYPPSAQCADGTLAAGGGSPVLSHTYLQGQAISLDVPPGPHTLVLTTYADEAGTMALGQACTTTTLQAGSQICFDLSVVPAPVGDDLSAGPGCTVTPNSCPAGYYCDGMSCQVGCIVDADCAGAGADGGASTLPYCDTVTHRCVECTMTSQCGANAICSSDHCVSNCSSMQKLCNGMCVPTASCCTAADCTTLPAPVACYVAACSGAGGSCSYPKKSGAVVCGSTCCNAINGTCNASCVPVCNSGYADCDGDASNGCETNLGAAGKKLCGGQCIPIGTCCTSSDCTTPPPPATCYAATGVCSGPGGSCSYTENTGSQICNGNTTCCNADHGTCNSTCMLSCSSGFFDCNSNVSDGCETQCTPTNGTGKCATGGGCAIASCNAGFFDCDASAGNGCECGTSCCTNPITAKPGCTTTGHSDGWGHSFSDCLPLGSPGNPANYSTNLATDAANADTTQAGTFSNGWICPKAAGGNTWTFGCKCVDTNGTSGSCTSWVYTASNGNCTDLNGTSRPCTDWIGHTYKSTGTKFDSGCLCPDPGDGTYF